MTQRTFLVEIGTEELPPKNLRLLAESFSNFFMIELNNSKIKYGTINWIASPRRLALIIKKLNIFQSDHILIKKGPSFDQSFDLKGKPTIAAKNWACSCGININQAEYLITKKGKWLMHRMHITGKPIHGMLVNMINNSISKLPILKLMRWGNSLIKFVRPVHTITLLFGTELILGDVLGVKSSRIIYGHRFMGKSKCILKDSNNYLKVLLEDGKVIADYELRKKIIKKNIKLAAKDINGIVYFDKNLLEEVTSLVEWPVVLTAKFEKIFLKIPKEVLIHTMKHDQKCFPVYNKLGDLLPYFIFVSNIESKDPKQIISGNEKVIKTRFTDAEFFFNEDRKKRLEDYLPDLKNILFQKKLGNLYYKTNRIQKISCWISKKIGANIQHTLRASLLSKCDLMTNMVFEFTSIQGIIGMYYARYDGELEEVAIALSEQYQPRFSGDSLPQSKIGCSLAISDKIDTLVGIFGIKQYPKGDKDPFSLRRLALGILRIIIEKKLSLDLYFLIKEVVYFYDKKLTNVNVINEVIQFILDRYYTLYQEKGYKIKFIKSVLACKPTNPVDFDLRIKAISDFYNLKEASELIEVNKRISNILIKSNDILYNNINISILKESAEIKLTNHFLSIVNLLEPYFMSNNYKKILIMFSTLCKPINIFFEKIMIMTKDKKIRINRLTLLNKLHKLFLSVVDLSIL
ncbi:Glycine--tRNA ligase beta subunit [Serratia symbiotica]|nr:Glycine--tRNA ligase beta subunit [Serratia symbiotica]